MTETKSILTLAEAIAAALEARDEWSLAFRPEVQLRPSLEVSRNDETKVLVVPSGQTFSAFTRGSIGWSLTVDVGILARCDVAKGNDAARPLLALVVELATFLVGLRVDDFDVAVASSVPENDPIWSPETLDKGSFLSVLRIPFSATLRRAVA